MRLIGAVETEKKAFIVYSILLEQGIHSTYEKGFDERENRENVSIWIYDEDQVKRAEEVLEAYKQNPEDSRYTKIQFPQTPPLPPDTIAESRAKGSEDDVSSPPWKAPEEPPPRRAKLTFPLTYFIVLICIFFYLWNGSQQLKMINRDGRLAVQIGMTPVQQDLMFDYPKSNQAIDTFLDQYSLKGVKELDKLPPEELQAFEKASRIPNFQGYLPYAIYWFKKMSSPANLDGPMFMKIRQGEFWRLFTPCLLHAGILHILFNMAWAWLLLKQVEQRLSKWKVILLILLIGIISNIAQYLVSGPYFLGFSGIVVGLVGFIRVRQRIAPWEGYPLQKSTFLFILIFVLGMSALEIFSLITAAITAKEISANIANTAHIIGGIAGAILGRLPFFGRSSK